MTVYTVFAGKQVADGGILDTRGHKGAVMDLNNTLFFWRCDCEEKSPLLYRAADRALSSLLAHEITHSAKDWVYIIRDGPV